MFQDILMDFSLAGLLLLVGYYLRAKVKVLQTFFIPVSVVAGVVGLLLGEQVLGRISPICIHWSENVSSFANPLLAILFVSQFLTLRINPKMIKKCSIVYLISGTVIFIQVLFAAPVVKLFGVPDGFTLLPIAAFYGAHGIPGMVAGVFQNLNYWNYDEAFSVGNTFATIGMLYGVIGGIIMINIAARKGWLVGKKAGQLNQEEMTGYVQKSDRKLFMSGVSSNVAVDPLAVHCAIIGAIMILGYWVLFQMQKISFFQSFAIQIPAIVIALIVDFIASKSKLGDILDGPSLARIGSTALEYLIITSVATTNLTVVMQYGAPILVVSVIVLALTTFCCLYLSKVWLKRNWFENAMVMFGSWTGSTATGLMLLRVADTDMKTDAGPNLMAATPFWQLSTQSFYLTVAPYLVITAAGFRSVLMGSAVGLVIFVVLGFIISRKS